MTKKKESEKAEEKVNQPAGAPVVANSPTPPSRETMSHQWQEDSPALNTNELAGYANSGKSVMDSIDTPEKQKALEQAEKLKYQGEKMTDADYEYRTKLDVSDPRYINPSLDHKSK